MVDYIAFIHKDRKSGYGVSFPDLPGVVTVADTLEGVRKEAEEALALHVEGMVEDGDTVPAPSTLDALAGADGFRDAVAVAVIRAPDTISFTPDPEFLRADSREALAAEGQLLRAVPEQTLLNTERKHGCWKTHGTERTKR